MSELVRLTPAAYVIHIFGGVRAAARAIGRTPGSVSKWQASEDERGCDGHVPSRIQRKILEEARKRGLDITADDLINGRKVSKKRA